MPLLEQLRPGAGVALARSAANLAEDDAYLTSLGATEPPWPLAWFTESPRALVRRSLAAKLGSSALVDAAMKVAAARAGAVQIGQGRHLRVRAGYIVIDEDPHSH